MKWGWIDKVPTDRSTPPQPVRKKINVPTPKQLSGLMKTADSEDPVLGTAVALPALTGARRGELVALRWSDIDLVIGKVTIARSITVAQGEQHTGPTKTHASRELALDPIGVDVLIRRRAYMVELSERAGSPLAGDPYVLSYNADGGIPVNPDTLTHRFGKLCQTMEKPALDELRKAEPKAKRGELPEGERWSFRFHDLRHFSVTTLIAAGVDIRTVSQRHGQGGDDDA